MEWTITMIEEITEEQAEKMALETDIIKDHNIYFVDFGGCFGYSVLVFKNNHHIHYANDYQLHHSSIPKESLNRIYKEKMNNILFTEAEISEPLQDYNEYSRKSYYMRNYYGMQRDYITVFCINPTAEQKAEFERKTKSMTYNPVSFGYYKDAEFVKRHAELMNILEAQKEKTVDSFEYQKNAFLHEMFNYEYGINWQADYDVLSVFGNITYTEAENDLQQYFEQLNFTDVQKKAYYAARKEYYANADF